jgi:hypothetical protein
MFRHLLVREIGVWLAIKLAALTAIFLLFFGPEQHFDVAAERPGGPNAYDAAGVAETPRLMQANTSPVRISLDY